ncbi:MAG: RNA 2',3'-cyclic phosphodiesterase [Dehalococcoidia bacterium]
MRLFVALELPQAWCDVALDVRQQLEQALSAADSAALRWVEPELLHLTLRFLGEFADARVTDLQSALDAALDVLLPLDLSSSTPGSFGGRNRLQVIWLGVDGDVPHLDALAREVERACVEGGAAPDPRPFAPHITLARVRERAPVETRRTIGEALGEIAVPTVPLRATGVALVRSHLGKGPPRYEVLSRHPRHRHLIETAEPADAHGKGRSDWGERTK